MTPNEKKDRLAPDVRREAERRDRAVKIGLLAVSLATLAFLAAAALRENVFTEWRHRQREYASILDAKATDDRGRKLARDFGVEMRQIVVPELGAVDRCVSCHGGLDDPRMTDVPNPHAVHPGRYLEDHEMNRFGCTVCHRGQGRAMTFGDAKSDDRHWDYPLLPVSLTQSSCGTCHSVREVADHGGDVYAAGAALFEAKGCRSCHKLDGRGGSLGPVLDNEGLKVRGELPMAGVEGPHTLPQWIIEHFADPQKIVAGSRMPRPGLSREETEALTTFLLSLQSKRDLPASYLTPEKHLDIHATANPDAMTGQELYAAYCSTCHDTGTQGRYDTFFNTFIPAVRGPSFQAAAEPAYVAANIRQGRQGTIMPAWGPAAGGLTEADLARLTAYLLGRDVAAEETAPDAGAARTGAGDPSRGLEIFVKNCTGCHGGAGQGKLGPSLDSPVFAAHASDAFLRRTIAEGRRNTAMPAFGSRGGAGLTDGDLDDLISFIRTLGGAAATSP